MNDTVLMIAARMPIPGTTKTRLGQRLGMWEASRLYEGFLHDIAGRIVPAIQRAGIDVVWTFSPPDADFSLALEQLGIGSTGTKSLPQAGDSWAERQDNLMRWSANAGYRRGILVASDSPHLPTSHLLHAFQALDDSDVVIGRVRDGGYYLIGMSGYHDVLLNVPMSTATAADALVANVKRLGGTVAEVPETFDVDEREDLDVLIATLSPDGGVCPATWRILGELGLTG